MRPSAVRIATAVVRTCGNTVKASSADALNLVSYGIQSTVSGARSAAGAAGRSPAGGTAVRDHPSGSPRARATRGDGADRAAADGRGLGAGAAEPLGQHECGPPVRPWGGQRNAAIALAPQEFAPHFAGQAATFGAAVARFSPPQPEVIAYFLDAFLVGDGP